ncbi:MAG: hypothetical protein RLZZ227_1846 [Pseudomonadota bacterium]|jgi:feruloyl esterase
MSRIFTFAFSPGRLAKLLSFAAALGTVQPAAAQSAAEACANLATLTIPATAIGLPTTGASIKSAEFIAANAQDNDNGEYCKVLGAIHPATYTAPDINFEVNLPTNWNRKTLQFGGGGLNGTVVTGLARYTLQPTTEQTPLARGYVTLGSDSGHQSTIGFDGRFFLNREAMDNYGHMQVKKTHDVAMQLIQTRYGAASERNYFIGGSQGGHEGFDALQRYPDDYDGVVAGYPAHNVVMLHLAALQVTRALMADGNAGWLNPQQAAFLVSKVYETCDALDAAADGIISNVAACRAETAPFKLTTDANPLRCDNGAAGGDACLSDAQITALNVIDSPYETGFPVFADDTTTAVFPKWTPFEGSTFRDGGLTILGAEGPRQALQAGPADATNRYAIAQDLNLNVFEDYDPKAYAGRIVDVATRISANGIVLDRFRAKGGKLIYYHGLVDDFITPYSSIQYHQRLLGRYGEEALSEFVRFYTIPGMGHGNGIAFNPRVAWLDALEAWVERGEAPGTMVGTNISDNAPGRTRPICEYPQWPRYTGAGDINSAASFSCVSE